MKAKKLLREFILRFDVFATPACLRYKGEPAYESVQCGLFSMLLIGIVIALFIQPVLTVLNKS